MPETPLTELNTDQDHPSVPPARLIVLHGRDVSQQGVKGMEHSLHCPNSSPGSDPLAYLCHTRFGLALNGLLVPPHQRVPRGLDMDPQDAFHQPPEQQRQP